MDEPEASRWISDEDQTAVSLRAAARSGDVAAIQTMLHDDPAMARARLGTPETGSATPLHLVADWPGYFPNGPQIVRLLISAGADPNALTTSRGSSQPGPGSETPLHYAASSDDLEVAEALIDGGADLEVPGGRARYQARERHFLALRTGSLLGKLRLMASGPLPARPRGRSTRHV